MSEEIATLARPKRKRLQPARQPAQRHAATDAVLTQPARCAIDLPTLAPDIPRTITLALETKDTGCLTDAMLNLALLGSALPDFELHQDKTFAQNVILAADHRLHRAIAPLQSSISLRWWGSAAAAASGTNPVDQGSDTKSVDADQEPHLGAHAVIEFDLEKDGDVHHAATLTNSSKRLMQCETICPGFTHLLYTVLDCVNDAVWPIFTPRTLWNYQQLGMDGWFMADKMCDAEIVKNWMQEYCYEEELAEKYGTGAIEDIDPANALSIYAEEVGGVLPSDYIRYFGRAAIGEWRLDRTSPHESIPDPKDRIAADLCCAMASVEARLDWCPAAAFALRQLQAMHSMVRRIDAGARLAQGANNCCQPSWAALQLFRFGNGRENEHFGRLLDDACRGAQESGDTVDVAGWLNANLSTPDKAATVINNMEEGIAVLRSTCTLILDLFYDPTQDE
ncbi:hypothetical protein RQP54_18240 [Curvibacter sp. APW13]|uniref:hypothetical protein n=1 Tax=Curvibacter sp. APW13 TaxID=3077236 RepID=UPI0028E04C0F|nr:hypothetical protein [Curvibacter sp. APW13]MDT8992819.1 hypothetical protein [Curvibacter sp. APW13]